MPSRNRHNGDKTNGDDDNQNLPDGSPAAGSPPSTVGWFAAFRNILFLHGPPWSIALGAAIGTFVAWLPLQGIQMAIAVPICVAVKANPLPAIPIIWLTNPLTAIPIYGFNYWIGWLVVGGPPVSMFRIIMRRTFVVLKEEGAIASLTSLWVDGKGAFLALWVGSAIVGAVLAVLVYFVVFRGVVAVRRGAALVQQKVSQVRERARRRKKRR